MTSLPFPSAEVLNLKSCRLGMLQVMNFDRSCEYILKIFLPFYKPAGRFLVILGFVYCAVMLMFMYC